MFPMDLIPPRITSATNIAITIPIENVEKPNSLLITCDTEYLNTVANS